MIYVYTQIESIKNYWRIEFHKSYGVTIADENFFHFNDKFKKNDILIFDIDQFKTVEEVMDFYNNIPKILSVIAIIDKPRLSDGAFFIKKGFKSYIGKKTIKSILNQAVETVETGNVWLYPLLMNYIIKHISIDKENENNSKQYLDQLTTKEQTVANFVAQGFSNKEIAENLDIQLVTVKKHIGSIFSKLNLKDRISLVILINS